MYNNIGAEEVRTEAKAILKGFKVSERVKAGRDEAPQRFYHLKDNAPQCVKDLVYKAHKIDDVLPNDYIYEFIVEALQLFTESGAVRMSELEEDINEIEPDVYNADLLRWVSDNLAFSAWVDEALSEYGAKDLFQALQIGQQLQRQAIARSVLDSIIAIIEEGSPKENKTDTNEA